MVRCLDLKEHECDNNTRDHALWLSFIGATDGFSYLCSSTKLRQGKSPVTLISQSCDQYSFVCILPHDATQSAVMRQ